MMYVRLLRKSWLLVLLVALVAPPSGADAGPADDPVSSRRGPTPFADSVSRSEPPASGLAAGWEGLAPPLDAPNIAAAAVLATATQVAAGRTRTCALTAASGVKCWGDNNYGQSGVARYWTPRYVVGFEPAPHFIWCPMIMAAGGG